MLWEVCNVWKLFHKLFGCEFVKILYVSPPYYTMRVIRKDGFVYGRYAGHTFEMKKDGTFRGPVGDKACPHIWLTGELAGTDKPEIREESSDV